MSKRPPILAVCGPTASGKSDVGILLAESLSGEVVSVDSVQIYRGADIGSAKVATEEQRGIPHHLLDILDLATDSNAASFCSAAKSCIDSISDRGKLPILTVGTTMYFTTLVHGIAPLPPRNDELRSELAALRPDQLFEKLREIDPERAEKLAPNDTTRVIRAIESHHFTARPQSEIHRQHGFSDVDVTGVFLVLVRPRDELYARIDARSKIMVERGLLTEARSIYKAHGENIPIFSTIGYREALQVLKGELPEGELAEAVALATRRYAKRQMTFWRNEPEKRSWEVFPKSGDPDAFETGKEGIVGRASTAQAKGFLVKKMSIPQIAASFAERVTKGEFDRPEVWYVMVG